MDDLKNALRDASQRYATEPDALERLRDTRTRHDRNQRLRAGAMGVGITALLLVGLITIVRGGSRSGPADQFPTPATTVPDALAFVIDSDSGIRNQIGILSRDGSLVRLIQRYDGVDAISASPDGRRLAFTGIDRRGHARLVVTEPTNRATRAIYEPPGDAIIEDTAWSPDGRTIAFVQDEWDGRQSGAYPVRVWIVDADGGQAKPVSPPNLLVNGVTWSSDGGGLLISASDWGQADGDASLMPPADIWSVPLGGAPAVNLTSSPDVSEWDPDAAPDGSSIVYVALDPELSQSQLAFLDLGTGASRTFTPTWPDTRVWAPTWSPDGSEIGYGRFDDRNCGVWTIPTQAEDQQLQQGGTPWFDHENLDHLGGTFCPQGGLAWTATSSDASDDVPTADASSFLFTHIVDQEWRLFSANADGSGIRRLTGPGTVQEASWSPDGTKIAYIRELDSTEGVTGLHVMNPDGSNDQVVAEDAEVGIFSPDGTTLTYLRAEWNEDPSLNACEIRVVGLDGSVRSSLPSPVGTCRTPIAWTPDGSELLVAEVIGDGSPNGLRRIATIRADGSLATALTRPDQQSWWAGLSPDGSRVAYVTDEGAGNERGQVFMVNTDGSDLHSVSPNAREVGSISWGPDGSLAYTDHDGLWIVPRGADKGRLVLRADRTWIGPLTWSPDGRHLLVERDADVWMVGADGSDPHLVVGRNDLAGGDSSLVPAAWRP